MTTDAMGPARIARLLRAPAHTTLLELVSALCDETEDDREVVSAVVHLLRQGHAWRVPGSGRADPAYLER